MAARKLPKSKLKRKRDKRPSAARRGYDYQWQKKRAKRVKKGAKCSRCKSSTSSMHFHHQPSGRTVPLCPRCHNSRTARNGKRKAPGHSKVATTRKSRRRARKK